MTREETIKAAETMLAHSNGEKIEIMLRGSGNWIEMHNNPNWNWSHYQYRIKPQQTSTEKELTEQESNFINSFIWYKPNYGYLTPLTGLNAIHVSKLYKSDNPHFLKENLFLNPFTNKWIEWTEEFRDELKKHYEVPAKPKPTKKNSIPAIEEELKMMGKGVLWCKDKKYPNRIGWIILDDTPNKNEWYIFNPDTKCWEDWKGV